MPRTGIPELTLSVTVHRDAADPDASWPDLELPTYAAGQILCPDKVTVTYRRRHPGDWDVSSVQFFGARHRKLKDGGLGTGKPGYKLFPQVPPGYARLVRDTFEALSKSDPVTIGKMAVPETAGGWRNQATR